MKRSLVACVLAAALPALARAGDDARVLLDKALDELARTGSVGDTSSAERYLRAALEQEPGNLEAQWQLLHIQLLPLKNVELYERTPALAALSPEFERLAQLAKKSNQEAFLHYMTATHAGYYNSFERALREIDKAVALDRDSVRYLTAKGRLLVGSGKWSRNNAQVEEGIGVLQQARQVSRTYPSVFVRDEFFEFYLADAFSSFDRPRWAEAAEHYERFLEKAQESTLTAFAWNNLSVAYRKTGACDRAQGAATKALAIMKFGAAQNNRRYADFCLEMQKSGVMAKN